LFHCRHPPLRWMLFYCHVRNRRIQRVCRYRESYICNMYIEIKPKLCRCECEKKSRRSEMFIKSLCPPLLHVVRSSPWVVSPKINRSVARIGFSPRFRNITNQNTPVLILKYLELRGEYPEILSKSPRPNCVSYCHRPMDILYTVRF